MDFGLPYYSLKATNKEVQFKNLMCYLKIAC